MGTMIIRRGLRFPRKRKYSQGGSMYNGYHEDSYYTDELERLNNNLSTNANNNSGKTIGSTLSSVGGGVGGGAGTILGIAGAGISMIADSAQKKSALKIQAQIDALEAEKQKKEEFNNMYSSDTAQIYDYKNNINSVGGLNAAYGARIPIKQLYPMGGRGIMPINSTDAVGVGPSHAQGGIDIGGGAEIEGGENVRQNPQTGETEIDSARMGTAQANQPLMMEKAKLEQQLQALKEQQAKLFLKQGKETSFRKGNEVSRDMASIMSQVSQIKEQLAGIQQAIDANFQQQQAMNGDSQGQPAGQGMGNPNNPNPGTPMMDGSGQGRGMGMAMGAQGLQAAYGGKLYASGGTSAITSMFGNNNNNDCCCCDNNNGLFENVTPINENNNNNNNIDFASIISSASNEDRGVASTTFEPGDYAYGGKIPNYKRRFYTGGVNGYKPWTNQTSTMYDDPYYNYPSYGFGTIGADGRPIQGTRNQYSPVTMNKPYDFSSPRGQGFEGAQEYADYLNTSRSLNKPMITGNNAPQYRTQSIGVGYNPSKPIAAIDNRQVTPIVGNATRMPSKNPVVIPNNVPSTDNILTPRGYKPEAFTPTSRSPLGTKNYLKQSPDTRTVIDNNNTIEKITDDKDLLKSITDNGTSNNNNTNNGLKIGPTGWSAIGQGAAGLGTYLANKAYIKKLNDMKVNYLDKKQPLLYTTNRSNVQENLIERQAAEARRAYQKNPTEANRARWLASTKLTNILEARRLGITVIAPLDTNCDPDLVDYPIPGNDDAIRSIQLFCNEMAAAMNEGRAVREDNGEEVEEMPVSKEEQSEVIAEAVVEGSK